MKLLLVSYFFPPHGGGGVNRAVETARLMDELGWEVTVLAGPEDGWWVRDNSLSEQVPESVKVIRPRSAGLGAAFGALGRAGARRGERRVKLLKSMAGWLPVVDGYGGWARSGARAALESGTGADWVLSSSPPESAHMAGMELARKLGARWVADFRDPWVKAIYRREPTVFHRRLHEKRESKVVRTADLVIATSLSAVKDFRDRYPDLDRAKFTCLTNGYDPAEFKPLINERKFNLPLKLIHAGNLTRDRNIDAMLEAIARVNRDGVLCRLDLAGQVAGRTLEKIRALGLEDAVTASGYVTRPELIKKLAEAHVGLLVETFRPGAELVVPGKLYDYLGAGLPTLAIVPPGAASELVDQERFGLAATEPDANRLENLLRQLIENVKRGTPAMRAPDILRAEKFERPRIVAELDRMLRSAK